MKYNKNEWGPWIELVNSESIKSTLAITPEKYKPLVAACLSVAKWHPDKMHRGSPSWSDCGLCLNYAYIIYSVYQHCRQFQCNSNCPIRKLGMHCAEYPLKGYIRQSYDAYAQSQRHKAADEMYELLLKIYETEYKKVIG